MKNLYGGHILATDAPMQSSIPDIYICKNLYAGKRVI